MASFFGTSAANTLYGTSGNDLLAGLGGNDTLQGYSGTDTAWYSGLLKDYLIGTTGAYLTLTDRNGADGDDGSDRLSGIETLAFTNGALQVSGGEFKVNTYTDSHQYQPAVTALADGGFVVTWSSFGQDGSSLGIYAQRYDAEGNASGGEFKVNTYTNLDQSYPAVTALADGGFVVTWNSVGQDGGTAYGIYAQRYDAGGNASGGEFRVNTYTNSHQYQPAVTALADGGFVVTWTSDGQDGSAHGIYAQRYDAGGNANGSEFQVNTYTSSTQSEPAVTALADGGFVVTWASDQDGSAYGIYAQRYDAEGNASGSEFKVNTYTDSFQYLPSVTALADGGFVVAWISFGQDGSTDGIYAQRYDAEGNASGGEFKVNTYTNADQSEPAVTALVDGGFVLTWTSDGQDGPGLGIYAQRYDAEGQASGSEFRVNTQTSSNQSEPAVTALADGGFVVTWTSDGQDGAGWGIYAQRYDAAGNPVGLKVTGTAAAEVLNLGDQSLLTVDGAGGNDSITGGTGNDNLYGGLGNDTLTGGAGDDRLDGGAGNDVMAGGNGSDTYAVDSVLDIVTETGASGTDTVLASVSYTLGSTLENLTLTGSANLNGTGNAGGNFITGNRGNNVLDGKAGGDLMAGMAGNDTYRVDNVFDIVSEAAGNGTDKVLSSVNFTLTDNVEHLELTGTLALTGTGNELANQMVGNAGNNRLDGLEGDDNLLGMAGNDTLSGGNGNDQLAGGLGLDVLTGNGGNDVFRFDTVAAATNVDHITDFLSGTDEIWLSQALFKNAGIAGPLTGNEFLAAAGHAANSSQHILYDTATGGLYYNADGAGTGVPVLIAVLDNAPALTHADLSLV